MTFKEIRVQSGMNLTQFSAYFGIPYRTIQHWEHGTRTCPEYLLELMKYKLNNEQHLVVHGEWIEHHFDYICSHCKAEFNDDITWITGEFKMPNFCPECGADMHIIKKEGILE